MDDSALVRRRESARDLRSEVDGLSQRQSARGDPLAQRLAVDELHDEEVSREKTRTGDFFE